MRTKKGAERTEANFRFSICSLPIGRLTARAFVALSQLNLLIGFHDYHMQTVFLALPS